MMNSIKSKLINVLHANGVYYGDKNGAKVKLEQMKEHQVINLYYALGLNK